MKTSIFLLLASSLATAPVAASENASKPIRHLHHVYRHAQGAVRIPAIRPDATAQAPQGFGPIFVPSAAPYRPGSGDFDGLSRDRNDCARGCIDSPS
jgi:hypothetical protein